MQKFLIILSIIYGGFCGMAIACELNEIDINGDGTECVNGKFAIKTTNLSNSDVFKFSLSASGTFTVNCGENGTLESEANDVTNGNTITRNDTTNTIYTCTYSTGGVKTIGFDGTATNYSTNTTTAALSFYQSSDNSAKKIASVSGNLSSMFPYVPTNASDGAQPRFYGTFGDASNLTVIPATLFANYTRGARSMFGNTFANCTKLTSIPAGLFSNITNGAEYMFYATFYKCTGLASLPPGLFSNITIGAPYMFRATFESCNSLKTIPSDLFSGLTIGQESMFRATFFACTGLTSIPENLFSGIITAAESMFYQTFDGCTNLSGYIPPSTFAGLIANGSPTATSMWGNTFNSTKLATSCPAGTVQFVTGYKSSWNGKVSCVDENLICNAGEYLPAHWYKCEPCPQNNYCPGGTYPYSETIPSGATQCPNNLYSPAGMSSLTQCGRILHIGDEIVYLHSTKKTTPALHVDIDQDGIADYFGNMTTLDVPMTRGTDKKLKLQYDGVTYSVYDDSVDLSEYQN